VVTELVWRVLRTLLDCQALHAHQRGAYYDESYAMREKPTTLLTARHAAGWEISYVLSSGGCYE
jgi:hypothetical protein